MGCVDEFKLFIEISLRSKLVQPFTSMLLLKKTNYLKEVGRLNLVGNLSRFDHKLYNFHLNPPVYLNPNVGWTGGLLRGLSEPQLFEII